MNFKDFYVIYLQAHKHPLTKIAHIIGNLLTVAYFSYVLLLCFSNLLFAPMLLFTPFIVYPFAWSSHLYIEKNKPLAWSKPIWAKAADWVMMFDLLRGKVKLDSRD